jgi:adenine specific DNA methylase Mod
MIYLHFTPGELSPNRALFWGDNLLIMEQLLRDGYKGKFDLIYFDGPFNSGRIFSMPNEKLGVNLINPWDELKGIAHYLNSELFLDDYLKRIRLAKELLSDTGMFVLQIYQKEGHYLKVMLDQEFGRDHFLAEIIWKIHNDPLPYNSQFGLSHECLFVYSRTTDYF